MDTELQKRQARAARFGTATEPDSESKDSEAQRVLERAKRFGTTKGDSAMGKLDEALPMARERERKRGADASTDMDDPGLKGRGGGKRFRGGRDGRPNGGARQNSHGNRGERPVGVSKGQPAYVSERDRAAAEARKKKFGA
jgi:SAP domain-containing ribonucleoprotein